MFTPRHLDTNDQILNSAHDAHTACPGKNILCITIVPFNFNYTFSNVTKKNPDSEKYEGKKK